MRIFTVKFFIYLLTSDGKRKWHLDNNHKARLYLALLIVFEVFWLYLINEQTVLWIIAFKDEILFI